jgi:hypothetical protein
MAEVAKQLVIMSLTVGKPLFLVVTMPQEGLFTLGADKVLKFIPSKSVTIADKLIFLSLPQHANVFQER